jgi:hypothetical protein
MLDKESLFFSTLSNLEDPWEGSFPKIHLNKDDLIAKGILMVESCVKKQGDMVEETQRYLTTKESADHIYDLAQESLREKKSFAINAWHINENESEAFWKIYSNIKNGIAVQSTIKQLFESLKIYKRRSVDIGKVLYAGDDEVLDNLNNAITPVMHKRKSFEHEKELRASIWTYSGEYNEKGEFFHTTAFDSDAGEYVNVDMNKLVSNVYISPLADKWFADLVKSVIKKYKFSFNCLQSKLYEKP